MNHSEKIIAKPYSLTSLHAPKPAGAAWLQELNFKWGLGEKRFTYQRFYTVGRLEIPFSTLSINYPISFTLHIHPARQQETILPCQAVKGMTASTPVDSTNNWASQINPTLPQHSAARFLKHVQQRFSKH